MSKAIQALLAGMFFTFICDFFFFLGIKLHYIDHYEVDVYYNILFADHQSLIIYTIFTVLFGFILMYIENIKAALIVIGTFTLLSILTVLIPPLGYKSGEMLLKQDNVTLKDSRYTYNGSIYYDGRDTITFFDTDVNKIIIIDKKDIQE